MRPQKEFLFGSLLVWLILLPTLNSLHAACDLDFGCHIAGNNDVGGFVVEQWGLGPAISAVSNSDDSQSDGVDGRSLWGTGVSGISFEFHGVDGYSLKSVGVNGVTEGAHTAGVMGESKSKTRGGAGVAGFAEFGNGVFGQSADDYMAGVYGENTKGGMGVYGYAATGNGVHGEGGLNGVVGLSLSRDQAGGRFGNTAQGWGVYAATNSPLSADRATLATLNAGTGYALQAQSKGGTGIVGKGLKRGVYGVATSTKAIDAIGVLGIADGSYTGRGVQGSAKKGYGVVGTSEIGRGVWGRATASGGWAAEFSGSNGANGVRITTNPGTTGLLVSGGSKSAVVPTSQGSRLLYAEEATEVYFTDYGSGRLTDGKAVIPVDPLFAETVNLAQPYHVFVQSYSDALLVVSRRSPRAFEVRLHARDTEGDRNAEFSYRLVAKRKGFEQARLEPSPSDKCAAKQMDAATSGELDQQAWLSIPEPADLSEPVKPSVPRSPLVEPPLRRQPNGTGK